MAIPKLKIKKSFPRRKTRIFRIEPEIKKQSSSKTPQVFYWEGVGRRKTSVARVRISKTEPKTFVVNSKPLAVYFPLKIYQRDILSPLISLGLENDFSVSVRVKGGGLHSQAEAIRHGLARALAKIEEGFRKKLRQLSYLTRDPRMRERKKFGLKRARRAPQWQKR